MIIVVIQNAIVSLTKVYALKFVFCAIVQLLLTAVMSFGQVNDSLITPATDSNTINPAVKDSLHIEQLAAMRNATPDINYKKRQRLITAANIIGYGGTMVALYSAWYKDYPQSEFHVFDDNHEWLQVDKIGHAYSAYIESRASMEMWRWAGLSDKKRIWIGGLSGAVYQTAIETLDAYSAEWGWSWGDFAANIAGSGMLISQELLWNEQRVLFKFSFHKKNYGDAVLNKRADELYGKSVIERMLKDYNGQTYWLSANVKSFFKNAPVPQWLNVAVGYGADGMLGAEKNEWTDKNGNTFNYNNIKRYRQFYLSPDIDFTRIKTKSKFLKTAFFVLSCFKMPAPSLEFSNGKFSFNWLHF